MLLILLLYTQHLRWEYCTFCYTTFNWQLKLLVTLKMKILHNGWYNDRHHVKDQTSCFKRFLLVSDVLWTAVWSRSHVRALPKMSFPSLDFLPGCASNLIQSRRVCFSSVPSLFFNLGNKNKKYKVIQISGAAAAAAAQWVNVALFSCSHHILNPAQCLLN